MEIVDRGPVRVVGIEVVAPWQELWTEVPEAWRLLRERAEEIQRRTSNVFIDVSLEETAGTYRQVVGAEVDSLDEVPEGDARGDRRKRGVSSPASSGYLHSVDPRATPPATP